MLIAAKSRSPWRDTLVSAHADLCGNSEKKPVLRSPLQEDVMPFKSQAQRRKFAQLLVEGKISNQTFEEWNRETGAKQLPERVSRKRSTTKKRSTASSKRKRTASKRSATKKR